MVRASVMVAIITVLLIIVAGIAYYAGLHYAGQAKPQRPLITTTTLTMTETKTVVETTTKTALSTTTATITQTLTKRVYEKKIVDAIGNIIEFSKPPSRVVSLSPSITEIICSLGFCDKLVGVDKYSNYPPKVLELVKEGKITVVGGYWNPDAEKILALKPDVVFANAGVANHIRLAEQLRSQGITVVFLRGDKAHDLEDIAADIMLVATILGNETRGKQLVLQIRSSIENVTATLASTNTTKPSTIVLLGTPKWGIWSAGGGTFIDYIVKTAGGVNVASKYHGWVMLSQEDLLTMNPSVAIITAMAKPREVLSQWMNTTLAETASAKNGTICVVTGPADDALVRPGPRIADAVKIVAWILHPSLFKEPAEYAQYIYCAHHGG